MVQSTDKLYCAALMRVLTGTDPEVDVMETAAGQRIARAHFETDMKAPSLDACVVRCGADVFTLEDFRRAVVQTKREFFEAIDNPKRKEEY